MTKKIALVHELCLLNCFKQVTSLSCLFLFFVFSEVGCRQLLVVQGVVYVFCSYPEMVVEQMSAEHVMIELYEDRIQQMDCHSGLH